MKEKVLYVIPGMGVDKRLFEKQFEHGFKFTVLEWIKPFKEESLEEYAARMITKINRDEPFILAGVSMGGIVAQEIAAILKPEKVIIISSIRSCKELPPHFRLLRKFPLHKLVPSFLYNYTPVVASIIRPVFGQMNAADKKAFREMVKDSDPWFIKWAVDRVINWKRKVNGDNVIQISGTSDFVFPLNFIKRPDYLIQKGSHLMIRTKAAEINKILAEELK